MTTVAAILGRGLLAARPAAGTTGLVTGARYFATDTGLEYQFDGTAWQTNTPAGGAPSGAAGGDLGGTYPDPTVPGLAGKANVAHTHVATDVTNLTAAINARIAQTPLENLGAPTSSVSLNNQTIFNLADPSNAQDAATKAYVDAHAGGSGLINPMTTQDDLIVGGASGAATRLGKGTDGQVLTVDPTTHHLVWATPAAGGGNLTLAKTRTDILAPVTSDGTVRAVPDMALGFTLAAAADVHIHVEGIFNRYTGGGNNFYLYDGATRIFPGAVASAMGGAGGNLGFNAVGAVTGGFYVLDQDIVLPFASGAHTVTLQFNSPTGSTDYWAERGMVATLVPDA